MHFQIGDKVVYGEGYWYSKRGTIEGFDNRDNLWVRLSDGTVQGFARFDLAHAS
jgi:hypothetical protein